MRFRLFVRVCLVVGLLLLLLLSVASSAAADPWYTLRGPVDPGQLLDVPFGARSFWLQPWRSSLVMRPAAALEDAVGINFNVTPEEAPATAKLLGDSGFRRARIEVGWDWMSFTDPSQLTSHYAAELRTDIMALRDNGIRPLILLNANSGEPVPTEYLNLTLAAPAARGARSVLLARASAAEVVPGLTGINEPGIAAQVLITQVSSTGVATLSQPLPTALPVGSVAAATLRYAPFAPPYLAGGKTANPRFEQTLAGWLAYVKGVCDFVRGVYGSDNFDVEVWNELSFGSGFLFENAYYDPVPDPGSTGNVTQALLADTIQMLRDPANGLTDVQIGDGFTNEQPWTGGGTVPAGTNGLDKHPYDGSVTFPGAAPDGPGVYPVNALGQKAYTHLGSSGYKDLFIPSFRSFFPEYYLTAIQTETLMRELSPMQTNVSGTMQGAGTHPPGGPAPSVWVTEVNLDQTQALSNGMAAADLPEFQAKAALRYYVSYASEGTKAIDMYAATGGGCCQMISQGFFNAVNANPASDPESLGGPTMRAVGRMTATLSGAQNLTDPRQLKLDAIAQDGDQSQFTGNGTAAFPSLYNRDVLAFFPFQVSQNKFVAAVYVMTRDLTHYYTSHPAPGYTPYDMPPEQFRLTIGNLDAASASVSLTDPLTGKQEPATIVSRNASQIVVQLPATDSPRMLTINDG